MELDDAEEPRERASDDVDPNELQAAWLTNTTDKDQRELPPAVRTPQKVSDALPPEKETDGDR